MSANGTDKLLRNASAEWGAAGRAWVERLPSLIRRCAQRWELVKVGTPYPEAQFNFVAPVRRGDGQLAVLKIGCPDPPNGEITREIAALTRYGGLGAARLLQADRKDAALLLQRAEPGTPLAHLRNDEQATRIAGRSMKALWRSLPTHHSFRPVDAWAAQRLALELSTLPAVIAVETAGRARALLTAQLAHPCTPVLLHGDLHHWNLLRAEGDIYWAIDPKGYCGHPLYDVIAWLRNWPDGLRDSAHAQEAMRCRVAVLSEELEHPPENVAAWAFAGLVLDAWFDLVRNPDDTYPMHMLRCAHLLAPLTA